MASKNPRHSAPPIRYLLGVDGGGTCCRAQLASLDGELLGSGRAGPANPLRNAQIAWTSILEASRLALLDAGLDEDAFAVTAAGVGLAGANVPSATEAIQRRPHPFGSMHLTTDMLIACYGAHGSAGGGVIISGTGCSGYSIVDGEHRVHSGFGFPFGDTGGSAWIGLMALRAALLAGDRLGPATSLLERINAHFDASGLDIVAELANAQPCDFGRLAPLVFSAARDGDGVAGRIIAHNANHISTLARAIWHLGPNRLSLAGGLAPIIEPWLAADVREMLSPPLQSPLDGAILYAREQMAAVA